jgi:phosphoglycolate phosphatase-like HAD superfamily hydrolase
MKPVFALDLDGTLLDCRLRQVTATAELLRLRGRAFPKEDLDELWRLKRDGLDTSAALIRCGVDPGVARAVTAEFSAVVEEDRFLSLDALLPDALDALEELRARGYRLQILTARQHPDRVRAQVERLLSGQIDATHVVSPFDAGRAKAKHLREIVAVGFAGDSESDAAAAVSAGVPFFAVCSGQRSPAFLEALGLRVYGGLLEAVRSIQK